MDVLPGIGTSGCATPPKDCTPASVPAAKGNICKNPQYDQYIKDALRRCGGNMMNGTVPGIEQYCPNYANLNQQQREGFWVRFVDALMIKESGCRANTAAQEVTGEWSEGLLQLSCGNSAIGHPGACSAINQRCGNEFITGDPNNDANREASGRPILDPKNNIDCGVCIMDGLSGNGITNNKTGIDRYWGPLRTGRSTQPQIMAEARAFPGCTGPAGAGPAAPAPVSADCGTAPQAPIPGSCKQSGAQITDYASKVKVELAVRQGLRDCSNNTIVVTDTRGTSVPCQVGQNGVTGRCTDVSRLQCSTTNALCNLYSQCGGFTVIGGSEGGHQTHNDGNAVDIVSGRDFDNSISQCIETKFQECGFRSGTPLYCDASGNKYWQERPGGVDTTGGSHWHACFGGGRC